MNCDVEEKEIYVYLDFSSCLSSDAFDQTKLFFKVVNLDQEHPLVQVGQFVFQGTYEDCVGTNVFFEEVEGPTNKDNTFRKKTPISLKYVTKQFKTLKMHWTKLPEELNQVKETELYDVKFKEDYETLLNKLEQGSLDFNKIIDNGDDSNNDDEIAEPVVTFMEVEEPTTTEKIDESTVDPESDDTKKIHAKAPDVSIEEVKYKALKLMIHEQLKRSVPAESVTVPANLRMNYEYLNLKNKMLQGNPFFQFISLDFDSDTLEGAVDINRCIRQGLLQFSELKPRILTEDEKKSLLTLENSQNLSIPMRYCVLRAIMKKKKRLIKQATDEELSKIDEFGVRLKDSYKLLKAVVKDMKDFILRNKIDDEILVTENVATTSGVSRVETVCRAAKKSVSIDSDCNSDGDAGCSK